MTDRDSAFLALRPEIATQPASGVEGFLHETLRPVLKLQNDPILALVATDVGKRIPGFSSFSAEDQRQRLMAMLKQDSRLKRVLLGVVWGMLTGDELAYALANEGEVRRRIVALLIERVVSQCDTVASLVRAIAPSSDA